LLLKFVVVPIRIVVFQLMFLRSFLITACSIGPLGTMTSIWGCCWKECPSHGRGAKVSFYIRESTLHSGFDFAANQAWVFAVVIIKRERPALREFLLKRTLAAQRVLSHDISRLDRKLLLR
jgi:hypothetical protein